MAGTGAAVSSSAHVVAGRKRSLSLSGEHAMAVSNKSFKTSALHLSPVPTGASRQKSVVLSSVASGAPSQQQDDDRYKPVFNVPVVAAAILYAAFQHVDHWPAPLVRAYADDCFGPRLWVDDPRCRVLVENLALVHHRRRGSVRQSRQRPTAEIGNENDDGSSDLIEEAKAVEEAYREFDLANNEQEEDTNSGSLLSSSLNTRKKSYSNVESEKSSSLRGDNDEASSSSSSDSGDEEEEEQLVVSASSSAENQVRKSTTNGKRENSGGGDSTSKEDEDEESMDTTSNGLNPRVAKTRRFDLYPIQQRRLNLAPVRKRYYGANLEDVYRGISLSLSDRLDVRSKQNSGLLQRLPSFASVPGIRALVAENLEKWLQSPALAGLARALFSSTVKNMENVDPPLDDDIKAVESILAMQLKANQVSIDANGLQSNNVKCLLTLRVSSFRL